MTDFDIQATSREDMGKGASRRLRRLAESVPAIVYGGKKKPAAITLAHKDISHALENEAFYSHIINLVVDGKGENVILKDVQRHPAKPVILHVDFQRISMKEKLTTRVPLHFINEENSIGVKQQGGKVTHSMNDIEITCMPADLPEYIEVDLVEVEVDQIVHLSDVKLPEGVESVALSHGEDHDLPVASVHIPKVIEIEEEAPEAPETEVAGESEAEAEGDSGEESDESDS